MTSKSFFERIKALLAPFLRPPIFRLADFILWISSNNSPKIQENSIIILRTDAIGDYLLFRAFLHELRVAYPNFHITLLGNLAYKDFFNALDSSACDVSVWVDIPRFAKIFGSYIYKIRILRMLQQVSYTMLINPMHSRDRSNCLLAKHIHALKKIAPQGDCINLDPRLKTRFLLKKRNFTGLIIDGSQKDINTIKRDNIYWRHDLEAVCAFITRENIDSMIQAWLESRELGNIALLSVDIDGVDYYVWEAITCIEPAIVVVEFNALLDPEMKLSVPYAADFERFSAHYSGLYFGASLGALIALGERKGYKFIGADSSGTNAFFLKKSILDILPFSFSLDSLEHYCASHKARQSRDEKGRLSFIAGKKRQEMIADLPLHSV